jgi:hypothetical protein
MKASLGELLSQSIRICKKPLFTVGVCEGYGGMGDI